jgi:hypothetical protein
MVYEGDALICSRCGGEMRFLSVIEERGVIEQGSAWALEVRPADVRSGSNPVFRTGWPGCPLFGLEQSLPRRNSPSVIGQKRTSRVYIDA